MMPYCEYKKCKKAAHKEIRLLRMWYSYDLRTAPNHTQQIWLCEKHLRKIRDLLGVEEDLS